jgi:hypothetical protein
MTIDITHSKDICSEDTRNTHRFEAIDGNGETVSEVIIVMPAEDGGFCQFEFGTMLDNEVGREVLIRANYYKAGLKDLVEELLTANIAGSENVALDRVRVACREDLDRLEKITGTIVTIRSQKRLAANIKAMAKKIDKMFPESIDDHFYSTGFMGGPIMSFVDRWATPFFREGWNLESLFGGCERKVVKKIGEIKEIVRQNVVRGELQFGRFIQD